LKLNSVNEKLFLMNMVLQNIIFKNSWPFILLNFFLGKVCNRVRQDLIGNGKNCLLGHLGIIPNICVDSLSLDC
jgi:hypothetical protein